MHSVLKTTLTITAFALVLYSCGGGKEKGKAGDLKAKIEKLKAEQKKNNDELAKLEGELEKLEPNTVRAKFVTIQPIGSNAFDHYIDLQGKIDAKNSAYVAPKGMGGVVRALYVKQGDHVGKGQVLAKLDDAVQRQQVIAAQQQTGQIQAQLKLAQTTYERQKNLWANNIGAEIQVIQAKTNVDALTSQLRAAEAQIQQAKEQLDYTNVRADISGVADQVNVKVGEAFVGMAGAVPQISIVNTSVLRLVVNVPETYIDRVKVGAPLKITLPDAGGKEFSAKASVVSKLIDPTTRSFYVEAIVPQDPAIRANQLAKVQIQDYSSGDAITVPVNTLQSDEEGKFVLVAVKEGNNLVARKKRVVAGELYRDKLEIKSGLTNGDQLITEGFQSLYDGQVVTTQASK
ncbi:efflux RND transporter periplasmic adaptor subunit [Niabella drilacis]|uniref:RND family efflux transporter, MFP subunit n=1 Tax=Niabella drilacis (strain DSM 25811 / CCM 8410 / CCUG 62505 / LMG 26954 / E90) TaxID=1285928 RepID=A0A1G6S8S8_NIADE|nr:efflux RND transporter periplasmic adaptor subunit [Niabella drilacis]SDD13340.1 RND family efflux transporter, MFP subunit [Niabella drilacis]